MKTRDAGLQLRRELGSGGRRLTSRKTLKFTLSFRMCNAYEQHVRWVEYCQMMQALELEIPTQQTELDLPQADHIESMQTTLRSYSSKNALVAATSSR